MISPQKPARVWPHLTDDEHTRAVAALTEAIGHEPELSWQKRIGIGAEGSVLLAVYEPEPFPMPALLPHYADHPWLHDRWDRTTAQYYPLAHALEVLRGPRNPELEMARRRSLVEANEKRIAAERAAEEERRAHAEAAAAESRRLEEAFDAASWYRLPAWSRALAAVAIKVEGGQPVVEAMRDVAAFGLERSGESGPPFPRCEWRPDRLRIRKTQTKGQ